MPRRRSSRLTSASIRPHATSASHATKVSSPLSDFLDFLLSNNFSQLSTFSLESADLNCIYINTSFSGGQRVGKGMRLHYIYYSSVCLQGCVTPTSLQCLMLSTGTQHLLYIYTTFLTQDKTAFTRYRCLPGRVASFCCRPSALAQNHCHRTCHFPPQAKIR
jgi:hypothetical protein